MPSTKRVDRPPEASGKRRVRSYTAAEKDGFFALLDRVGSVSAAAKELGINVGTAYGWACKAGAVVRRPRQHKGAGRRAHPVSEDRKDEFFTVLARVGSVSVAARELGLHPNTCFSWARAAGIASIHPNAGKREQFARLREAGASRSEAAAAVGVHRNTAYLFDNGLVSSKGRISVYQGPKNPDDQEYKQEVTATLAPPQSRLEAELPHQIRAAGPAPSPQPTEPVPQSLEQAISSRYLSLQDRELIADQLRSGSSVRAVARALGRSPSSISREISRNSHPVLGYQPYGAHRAATGRRARPKDSKLAAEGELRGYVKAKLQKRWSPEQISNLLIKEFPDDHLMRVSPETIYQSLYLQARGGLKREVKAALRTGRTRRKKRNNPEERTPRFRDDMINISERPPEVEDRAVPGHWEGDLITGARNRSAIATLVERTTRYVMLVHLPVDHTAPSVRDGLIKTMATLPEHLRGSLTWDQGNEMALHQAFGIATDMDVYFCDPASPWQRGSNENTNGLLRQYFPKGTDLNAYGPEDLEHVANELNTRPRKTLAWDTPAERLRDLLIPN